MNNKINIVLPVRFNTNIIISVYVFNVIREKAMKLTTRIAEITIAMHIATIIDANFWTLLFVPGLNFEQNRMKTKIKDKFKPPI